MKSEYKQGNITERTEVIQQNTDSAKTDSSYLVCGENVDTEEKIVHGAETDYHVICIYEFIPCE